MSSQGLEEVELIDYLRVIWQRRKFILLGTLIPVIIVGVVSAAMTPLYEATTQIRIGRVWDKEIENPYFVSELITSDAFLNKVVQKLNPSVTPYELKQNKMIDVQVVEGGTSGPRVPILLSIKTRAHEPKDAVDFGNMIADLLVEQQYRRFDERLQQYLSYEKDLEGQVDRMEEQINVLEKLLQKQSLSPTVNAPAVILLQAQLEQKNVQLLSFKKELKETKVNNLSSIVTESTKIISPPVLPKNHINPRGKFNMAVAGALALFLSIMLAFFLEYLKQVNQKKQI